MDKPIHIAITRRVRKTYVAEFERAPVDFASERFRSSRAVLFSELVKIAHGWLYPKNKVSKYS
jgi:hypothetical protein